MMGLPDHYTLQAMNKTLRKSQPALLENTRLSMLGTMGSVPVVAVLLMCLLSPKGLCEISSFRHLKSRLYRQTCPTLQRFLITPSCKPCPDAPINPLQLIKRLCTFLSTRGSDVLLCAPSAHQESLHRFRRSLPPDLWLWREVCGWFWREGSLREHISLKPEPF